MKCFWQESHNCILKAQGNIFGLRIFPNVEEIHQNVDGTDKHRKENPPPGWKNSRPYTFDEGGWQFGGLAHATFKKMLSEG